VEALQRELAAKKDELRDKDTLANAKLQQMVRHTCTTPVEAAPAVPV
jgi:AmiR/NasT family two-component response regulator